MPTSTFFRLPEEKRDRLIEACWAEMTRVRFTEISISRIITAARIPRGSFYQYFTDKEDLVRYLLESMRGYFVAMLRDILTESGGDLFAFPLMAYDRFLSRRGGTDPMLELFIKVLRLNKGMDLQTLIGGSDCFLLDQLWEAIDPGLLLRDSREYADHVFHMACAVLALAVVETLRDNTAAAPREGLKIRMDMLRYGSAADSYKEAAI